MKQTIEQIKIIVIELKQWFEKSLPFILLGAGLGYAFNNYIESKISRHHEAMPFATVEDMSFLVQELKDCRENSGSLDGSY